MAQQHSPCLTHGQPETALCLTSYVGAPPPHPCSALQFAGTTGYMAPRIALNQGPALLDIIRDGKYPPLPAAIQALLADAHRPLSFKEAVECDVYSSCVTVWEVITGHHIGNVEGFLLQPGATEEEREQLKWAVGFGNPWSPSVARKLVAEVIQATNAAPGPAMVASNELALLVVRGLRNQGRGVTLEKLGEAARKLADALTAPGGQQQPELLEPEVVEP